MLQEFTSLVKSMDPRRTHREISRMMDQALGQSGQSGGGGDVDAMAPAAFAMVARTYKMVGFTLRYSDMM